MDTIPDKEHRKIIHIDMDAFYASVEQRDDPELRGKAIAVGGSPTGRGVIATASYEARKFGVHSAMASRTAMRLCPELILVPPRFPVYKEVSAHIREIFSRYTDLIEPLSLDEAYLDVTQDKQRTGSAIRVAQLIRQAIKDELNLTASAGVSINKFVAKIASGMQKPDGLTFIAPEQVTTFMEQLPVEKFHGVGRVTADKMKHMGVHTGADLKALTEAELTQRFGKTGAFYYRIVRGIDDREVRPDRETKSVGAEDTFQHDLATLEEMYTELDKIAAIVHTRLQRYDLKGKTITLKIKFSDFKQITRNRSLPYLTNDLETIKETAKQLLAMADTEYKMVRLLGITVSNFNLPGSQPKYNGSQLSLF